MSLHPFIRNLLDASENMPRIPELSVEDARFSFRQRCAGLPMPSSPLSVENITVLGADGAKLSARCYRSLDSGIAPVLLFFHGGGFVVGDLDTHDSLCRQLCLSSACIVLAVDYRLAPEHPYPAAAQDAWAAYCWVLEGRLKGGDLSRVVLCGDSAGANLAAVTALRAREESAIQPAAQLLIYPLVDEPYGRAGSYVEMAEGFGLTRVAMRWYWDQYLQDHIVDQYAAPLKAERLENLPATLVITAEYDVLRDEGEDYALRLLVSGVAVKYKRYCGVNHGFLSLTSLVDVADQAMADICNWLAQQW